MPDAPGGARKRPVSANVGLAIVVLFVIVAVAAPLLAPQDPTLVDAAHRLQNPSMQHPLGTDDLGRDLLSRLIYGSRWSLGAVSVASVTIVAIGVTVGAAAGYVGGFVDDLLMRIVDVLLAIPSLLLALAIAGTLGAGVMNALVALVSVWWAAYARVVRGLVLALRERNFVEAARALGATDRHIVMRHVLRNVMPTVTVLATVQMGELILAISGLNFLGLGAQPPTPEWGEMLNQGRPFLFSAPQLMIYPGAAITLLVGGFNLIGDGLRDAMDPRS